MLIMAIEVVSQIMDNGLYHLILSTIIVVCILTGPMVALIIRHQRKAKAFDHTGLEMALPGSQLRLLAGVYSPRHMPAIINLVEMSRGGGRYPFAAYLMHLVELTEQTAATLLCDKRPGREKENDDDDDEHGGEEELLINAVADGYTRESGVALQMLKAVSDYRNMHEDVCNAAEDVRASVLVLPFHKHRRLDGAMEVTKGGYRAVNKKVMARGRCTVALLVDRGPGQSRDPGCVHQQVAVLFFGGADDREALSYAARLAGHPSVSVTVVRMAAAEGKEYEGGVSMDKDEGVLNAIAKLEDETTADKDFLFQYCQR